MGRKRLRRDRIYPVPVKPASAISTWRDWPDDVRETILDWNRRRGLTFIRTNWTFRCVDCEGFCEAHANGAAVFPKEGLWLCDDCLIERARAGWVPEEFHPGFTHTCIPRGGDR